MMWNEAMVEKYLYNIAQKTYNIWVDHVYIRAHTGGNMLFHLIVVGIGKRSVI